MKRKAVIASMLMLVALGLSGCTGDIGTGGLQGPQGEPGQTGPQGEPGKDGTSLLTGKGIPSTSLGSVGDSYIDTDTWDYYVKGEDGWVKAGNIKGEPGQDGEDGAVGPVGSQGEDGLSAYDIYIKYHPEYEGDEEQWIHDLVNGNLYEPAYYTLSFDTQGGDNIDPVSIREGEAIGDYLPSSIYREAIRSLGGAMSRLRTRK